MGRLYEGIQYTPLGGAHVFALAPDTKRIIAHTMTATKYGPDLGWWQLAELPANGEVILLGFHEQIKTNFWATRFTLNGQTNDLKIVKTNMSLHTPMPHLLGRPSLLDLLDFAGWITKEQLTKQENDAAVELANTLLAELRKR